MSVKGSLVIAAFVAVAIASAFGLYRLFALRLEKGDVFPRYSTLRSDPLGCKALFDVLQRSEEVAVERNFQNPKGLQRLKGRTVYVLGVGKRLLEDSSESSLQEVEEIAGAGNRVVIAFHADRRREAAAADQEENCDCQAKQEAVEEDEAGIWGVGFGSLEPPAKGDAAPEATLAAAGLGLPPKIPLKSGSVFVDYQGAWHPVYRYGDDAVVLERPSGKGSIVLVADSYLFSNEALLKDPCPGLLAWIQGESSSAVFDESHLGVYDTPGVMALMKKDRLIPFLWALAALAALHLWKRSTPFAEIAPPERELGDEEKGPSFGGLVNLLRRNIDQRELLATCVAEWSRSFSRETKKEPDLTRELREVLEPHEKRDPVTLYRKLAEVVARFGRLR